MHSVWIGTSGWTYPSWRGRFYPPKLPQHLWLEHYAGCFPATEVNGSFYRTPSLEAVAQWRERTPRDFVFAWKASRFITHWKRLQESSRNSIALMATRLDALGPKAGPVLFQLPEGMQPDLPRLHSFIAMLPTRYRYAVEFRNPAWYTRDVFAALRRADVALCISDHHQAPSPWIATAGHVYIRGHGPGGDHRGNYPAEALEEWASRIAALARKRRRIYVFFNNDQKSAAPADAERLTSLLLKSANHPARPGVHVP